MNIQGPIQRPSLPSLRCLCRFEPQAYDVRTHPYSLFLMPVISVTSLSLLSNLHSSSWSSEVDENIKAPKTVCMTSKTGILCVSRRARINVISYLQ